MTLTVSASSGGSSASSSTSETFLGIAPFGGYRMQVADGFQADFGAKLGLINWDGDESFKTFQALAGVSKSL